MTESPTDLMRRVEREGNPLIDGRTITWVWKGRPFPRLVGDWTGWSADPVDLERIGRGVSVYRKDFPTGAYLEYAFVHDDERLSDPHNTATVDNGHGKSNHIVALTGWHETTLTRRPRSGRRGTVDTLDVDVGPFAVGNRRRVTVYRPPTADDVPLLVALDGNDYARRARLPAILDNLIAMGRIRPVAAALVQNAGDDRRVEYLCSDATVGLLLDVVIPVLSDDLGLAAPRRQPYGIAGASMGGLQALWTALRAPKVFGRVLSQSGAYRFEDVEPPVWELLREGAALPQTWLDVGRYDLPGFLGANRKLRRRLRDLGAEPGYREHQAGHNWTAWRNSVGPGLEHLFGI